MGKTCALSGHRVLKKNFNINYFRKILFEIIESGYDKFYVGMARGFDLEGCKILQFIRAEYRLLNIRIIACLPCPEQDKFFSEKEKADYINCLKDCDEIIYISDTYINGCMQMRNRYMIDNCNLLLAYIYKDYGGTFYTINYARRKNKEIIYI